MKIFQKSLILCLAAVLVLGLAACGPKGESGTSTPNSAPSSLTDEEIAQIVAAAPGKLTIYAGVELTLGYNENGNALAVIGNSEVANQLAAESKVANLPCADAVAAIISVVAKEYAQMRGYITIRQELGGPNPSDDFMTKIADVARAATETPIVVVSIADMDETGYFNQLVAKSVIRAAKGEHAEIVTLSDMHEGKYVVILKENGENVTYLMSALSGSLQAHSDTIDEPKVDQLTPGPLDVFFDPSLSDPEQEMTEEEQTQEETPAA